ncbi:MAG: thioredoxin [Thermoplasmata archaeon]|nr:thioredoxin [Thermoplasmata archaeon]
MLMLSEVEEIRWRRLEEMKARVAGGGNGFPDSPVVVTDSSFEEFIGEHDTVVVDCWAPWCAPCRMLSPTIDAMAKDYKGKVVFGKLNTDENFETAAKFGIMSIPTLLYFRKGELVHKTAGALPRSMIDEQLETLNSR